MTDVDVALQAARDDPDVILAAAMSCKGDLVTGMFLMISFVLSFSRVGGRLSNGHGSD